MEENKNGLRVILIDPFKEKIRVAYPSLNDYMKSIKAWMDVRHIDIVTLDDKHMLIVDDEGLLKNPNRYFRWEPLNKNLAGKAVIVGYNEEGETTDARYHPRDVEDKFVRWIQEGYSEEPFMQYVPFDYFLSS